MQIRYGKTFKAQYKKLPPKVQAQFEARLRLFIVNRTAPVLRIHPLQGKFGGYWSMNVNGDVRAIYRQEGDTLVIFALIGTHSQLYG